MTKELAIQRVEVTFVGPPPARQIAQAIGVTEVEVELPRDDGDATAPVLDEAWVGTEGEWLTSISGLRYRFFSYVRP